MRIVVTGASGFMGLNLRARLRELGHADVRPVTRETSPDALRAALADAEFVFHLAGANRPPDADGFTRDNVDFTERLCAELTALGRAVPVAFASSTQAALDNPYGRSKRAAEEALERYAARSGARVFLPRLPNVFGKWSRPNYNSAVATFCHNLARGLPIVVNDPATPLTLLYVDDAVTGLVALLDPGATAADAARIGPTYAVTLGELVALLRSFPEARRSLVIPPVGAGLARALYATYLSHLPPDAFAYDLPAHADPRGVFVEMLKTHDSGQISFFTAPPGVTRGEHYHHTKNEKFLVVRGEARFAFRHLVSGASHELVVRGDAPRVVETVPGWVHNVTNVGTTDIIVLLWANEQFDPVRPDTHRMPVDPTHPS